MLRLKLGLVGAGLVAVAGYVAYKKYKAVKQKKADSTDNCTCDTDWDYNGSFGPMGTNAFGEGISMSFGGQNGFGSDTFSDGFDDSNDFDTVNSFGDNDDFGESNGFGSVFGSGFDSVDSFGTVDFDTISEEQDAFSEPFEPINDEVCGFGETFDTDDNSNWWQSTEENEAFGKGADGIEGIKLQSATVKNTFKKFIDTAEKQWNTPIVKNVRKSTMTTFRNVLHNIDSTLEKGINDIK